MSKDGVIPSEDRKGFERIPTKSQLSYSEICLFEKNGYILLFNKNNCKVSVSVDLMAEKMHATTVSSA